MPANNQEKNLEKLMYDWVLMNPGEINIPNDYYCETSDVFQARWSSLPRYLIKKGIREEDAYIISAIAGEIGNNSFDHNLGSWPDIPGIFFAHGFSNNEVKILLADRGQGILKTLKKIRPDLQNDQEAIRVAFTERISGRSPEKRGNGLKFVKKNVQDKKMSLNFVSGNAEANLNEDLSINKINRSIRGCLAILNYRL